MTGRLTYLAYAAAWAVVRALPERLARTLFRIGADLACRRRGKGVRRLEANLRRVLGPAASAAELADATRAGVRSYARYWLEVFRLPATPPEVIVARVRTVDEHRLRDTYASGRGIVVALPHQANWDHAGAWAVLTGLPFTTVAERLQPAALFDRFVDFRTSLGMEVVPLTGAEATPFDLLAQRLENGAFLALLADRDLTARGIDVDLFGATARMPAGPAALALRTGAALMPATLWYDGPLLWIRFHEEVVAPPGATGGAAVAAMTQEVARAFEEGIRAHPADWHMLQRLWLADLDQSDPRRRPQAEAAAS